MTPLSTTPLLAFLVSLLLHLAATKLFPRLGLLDFPERYGLTRGRLPYPTGIVSVITFLLLTPLLWDGLAQGWTLIISICVLGVVCFLDDRKPRSPLLRLCIQALLAFALFAAGARIYSLTNPFPSLTGSDVLSLDSWTIAAGPLGTLPILSGIFSIVWLLLTINALNWFDGISGQVSCLSTIGFLTIGLLSLSERVNQPALGLVALALSGIALGSFFFDLPPNRVVMGDTGAMFFGLMLGVLTIASGGKVATTFLVLGVPLFDVGFVMLRRISRGHSPIRGSTSDEHLHHRLLKKGWSPRQVIALTATIGAAFGVSALFLTTAEKVIAAIILFGVMLLLSWYSGTTRTLQR